jgi:superfamily II DNA or RNA helicase
MNDLFGLRDYQSRAVAGITTAWNEGVKAVCYQLATGGGKTAVFRAIVDSLWQSKKTIYVIAHRRALVDQISREFAKAKINHGLITPDNPYVRYRVQVASLGTIIRRTDRLPEPEIIIIEECHHVKARSYMKLLERWPSARVLGVTATPGRTDGSPLGDVFQRLILGPSMRSLINDGYLSDYDYYAPSQIDMSGVHRRGGDYVTKEAEAKVGHAVVGCAVAHYQRYADHQPAIVSCVSIAHADQVAEQFRGAGYRAKAVHSELDQTEIQAAIDGLRTGEIELLMQCELLGEGIDIPGASVLIGLRPTASAIVFLQHVGRVLRRAEGKGRAIILDHVGNWERHGLPDDERHWSLDGRDAVETGPSKYKRCPDCLRIVVASSKRCESCGHVWATVLQDARIPTQVDGELVPVRGGETRVTADWDTIKQMIIDRARSLKEAIDIARSVGGTHRQAFYVWTRIMKKSA